MPLGRYLSSYILSRFGIIIIFSMIGSFFPLQLQETALYYLLSSIFKGLAAVLGLFIVSYVFMK